MSARTVIAYALRVYYQDSRDPAGLVEQLLGKYDAELLGAQTGEKSIPAGVQPVVDVATHRHPRPCEFPTVLPCQCVRPGHLPEASFLRARKRQRIGDYFAGVKQGHDDRPLWAGENW